MSNPGAALLGVGRVDTVRGVRSVSGCEIAIREVPDSCILLFSKEANTETSHSDISDIRIIRISELNGLREAPERVF